MHEFIMLDLILNRGYKILRMRVIVFIVPRRKEEGTFAIKLYQIHDWAFRVSRISPAINVRLVIFSIIYKDGYARVRDQREKRESIMVIFNEERRIKQKN